jgi:hypothetical protein
VPVRDRAEQAVEDRHLTVEAGAAEDLGRHRRPTGDTVVEALLLDRPGGGLVEAAGDGSGLDSWSAGQDRAEGDRTDEQ